MIESTGELELPFGSWVVTILPDVEESTPSRTPLVSYPCVCGGWVGRLPVRDPGYVVPVRARRMGARRI